MFPGVFWGGDFCLSKLGVCPVASGGPPGAWAASAPAGPAPALGPGPLSHTSAGYTLLAGETFPSPGYAAVGLGWGSGPEGGRQDGAAEGGVGGSTGSGRDGAGGSAPRAGSGGSGSGPAPAVRGPAGVRPACLGPVWGPRVSVCSPGSGKRGRALLAVGRGRARLPVSAPGLDGLA